MAGQYYDSATLLLACIRALGLHWDAFVTEYGDSPFVPLRIPAAPTAWLDLGDYVDVLPVDGDLYWTPDEVNTNQARNLPWVQVTVQDQEGTVQTVSGDAGQAFFDVSVFVRARTSVNDELVNNRIPVAVGQAKWLANTASQLLGRKMPSVARSIEPANAFGILSAVQYRPPLQESTEGDKGVVTYIDAVARLTFRFQTDSPAIAP